MFVHLEKLRDNVDFTLKDNFYFNTVKVFFILKEDKNYLIGQKT